MDWNVLKNITYTTGVNGENYPITGAAVEMLTVSDGTYQMQMVSALEGLIVGDII